VFKAYTSRVGYGPFPSELLDEVGDQIRERGHEFGTVTGRPRRIGWFDSAVARYSARLNGIGCAALMRLDILDEQPLLKICTGYDFRGKKFDHPVANISHYKHSKPIYEEMPGWESDIGAAREWNDLPPRCRDYVERIGELIGVPIELVGTGPRRDQFVTRGRELFD
jgi:adenylosuccinate synthase